VLAHKKNKNKLTESDCPTFSRLSSTTELMVILPLLKHSEINQWHFQCPRFKYIIPWFSFIFLCYGIPSAPNLFLHCHGSIATASFLPL